jgi:hypothetical protein
MGAPPVKSHRPPRHARSARTSRNPTDPSGDVDRRSPREWPDAMTARVAGDFASSHPSTIRKHVRPIGKRGRALVFARADVLRWMRGTPIDTTSRPYRGAR